MKLTEVSGYSPEQILAIRTEPEKKEERPLASLISDLANELRDFGLEIDGTDFLLDGNFHNVHTATNGKRKPSGWYIASESQYGLGCTYGDFRLDEQRNTFLHKAGAENVSSIVVRREIEEAKKQHEAKRLEVHENAAKKASNFIAETTACSGHPYLDRKQLSDFADNCVVDKTGKLVFPIVDIETGKIWSYQTIDQDGGKHFLPKGKVFHHAIVINPHNTQLHEAQNIVLVEGVATGMTLHQATQYPVVCATSAGNLKHIVNKIRAINDNCQIIIAADNDNHKTGVGEKAARQAAETTQNAKVVVPLKDGMDFNDVHCINGLDEVKKQVTPDLVPKHFQPFYGDVNKITYSEFLVDDWFPKKAVACLFAPPASLKSFLALDIGLSISTGNDWHGKPTEKGAVVYIAGEGHAGLQKRVAAWRIKHQVEPENFYVSDRSFEFLEMAHFNKLIEDIHAIRRQAGEIKLVVIDTLNRNFGAGDENSTKDMTAFIGAVDELKRISDSAILIVHHTNLQNADRARGSSALRGAMDLELCINPEFVDNKAKSISLICTKMKDDEPPEPIGFVPVSIDLGITSPKGKAVNSLVLHKSLDTEDSERQIIVIWFSKLLRSFGNFSEKRFNIAKRVVCDAIDKMATGEMCQPIEYSMLQLWRMYNADISLMSEPNKHQKHQLKKTILEMAQIIELDPQDMVVRFNFGDADKPHPHFAEVSKYIKADNVQQVIDKGYIKNLTAREVKANV